MYRSLSTTIRHVFDKKAKAEAILEEVKQRDSGVVILQHDKQTGDMSYVRIHPKSKDHVIYHGSTEGNHSETILHRRHIEQMLDLLDKEKEKKKK